MATSPTVSTSHTENAHGHHPSLMAYVLVWAALIVLTFVTYFTGRMHFEHGALALALAIACTKAGLVIAIFMHLYYTRGAPLISLSVSILFVLTLIAGVLGDLAFRFPYALPPNAEERGTGGVILDPPIGYNMGDGPDGHYHGGNLGNPQAPDVNAQMPQQPK